MADTAIEWAHKVWNFIAGCDLESPGCTNCYAMPFAARLARMNPGLTHYRGLTKPSKAGPIWTGKIGIAGDATFLAPLRWKKPARIFVNSMADLFHPAVPDEIIDRAFAIMALCPQHTFMVLTKRSARMRTYFAGIPEAPSESYMRSALIEGAAQSIYAGLHPGDDPSMWLAVHMPLSNVWLGVSVEDQTRADERIPDLLETPAAIRWISAEPLLGPLDLHEVIPDALIYNFVHGRRGLDLVIVGGESGRNARPMHPDWVRQVRDQCVAADVPFFFKQWGTWFPKIDRDLDDPDWRERYSKYDWPDFRILNLAGGHGFHGERVHVMARQSKKNSGRLLDGRTWDQMPRAA